MHSCNSPKRGYNLLFTLKEIYKDHLHPHLTLSNMPKATQPEWKSWHLNWGLIQNPCCTASKLSIKHIAYNLRH